MAWRMLDVAHHEPDHDGPERRTEEGPRASSNAARRSAREAAPGGPRGEGRVEQARTAPVRGRAGRERSQRIFAPRRLRGRRQAEEAPRIAVAVGRSGEVRSMNGRLLV